MRKLQLTKVRVFIGLPSRHRESAASTNYYHCIILAPDVLIKYKVF